MNKLVGLFVGLSFGFLITFEGNTFGLKKCIEKDKWTIHGYWVDKEYCSNTTLNITDLEPIMDDMNKYWYSCYEDNEKFWDHEWRKHGSCYVEGKYDDSKDALKYFNDTLQLFFKNKEIFNDYCDEHYSKSSITCDVKVMKNMIFELPSFVVHNVFENEY